ncbi:MAG: prenyltransferase [Muribaculaceae bacterium]|nr:prenyltransferase [Muribaculaceae bacterium]
MMSPRRSIFSSLRLSSLMLGIGCVLAGTACAALHGNTEILPASICLIFVVFAQMAGNFYYRYYDLTNSPGAGISQRLEGHSAKDSALILKECSFACALLAAMSGMTIAAMGGVLILSVGLFTSLIAWLGLGGSVPLLRTPYGIVCPFILFGPICVITTSLLQSMHEAEEPLNWFDIAPALYMSIVMGLMCVNATMLYGYANYHADRRDSKQTLAATVGRKKTRSVFLANSVVVAAISIAMCVQLNLAVNGIDFIPAVICFSLNIYIWQRMKKENDTQLRSLIDMGNFNVLLMGLISFIIYELTGAPDDSTLTFFGI